MFCAGCAASVEAVLARTPGVEAAAVNFAADAAVVAWRPGATTLDTLLDAVRRLGYEARAVGDGDANPATRDNAARDFGRRLNFALVFALGSMLPMVAMLFGVADHQTLHRLAWGAGLLSLPVITWCAWPFYRMAWST
ncbi:MAG: cation transporter, partial [Pseudomonadota bacterium]